MIKYTNSSQGFIVLSGNIELNKCCNEEKSYWPIHNSVIQLSVYNSLKANQMFYIQTEMETNNVCELFTLM